MTPEQRVVEAARKWAKMFHDSNCLTVVVNGLYDAVAALPEPAPTDGLPKDVYELGAAACEGAIVSSHFAPRVARNVAAIVDAALKHIEFFVSHASDRESAEGIIAEFRRQLAERWRG